MTFSDGLYIYEIPKVCHKKTQRMLQCYYQYVLLMLVFVLDRKFVDVFVPRRDQSDRQTPNTKIRQYQQRCYWVCGMLLLPALHSWTATSQHEHQHPNQNKATEARYDAMMPAIVAMMMMLVMVIKAMVMVNIG